MKTLSQFYNDTAITFNGKGVIAYLLANNIIDFKLTDIINASPQGKDTILRMLNELVARGYLTKQDSKNSANLANITHYTITIETTKGE